MQTPRKYEKWKVENLKKAVEAIKQGELSLNEAAYEFCIPKATLSRHINEKKSCCCKCEISWSTYHLT